MNRRFVVLLLLTVMAGTAAWARKAPDFMLKDPDGRMVSLSDYKGKYVVLEFLLTTCPHCQASARVLQKLATEYPANLQVVGISMNFQGTTDMVKQFKQEQGVAFPVLMGDLIAGVNYIGITPQHPNFHVPVFFVISPTGDVVEERNSERPQDRDFYANTDQNLEAMVRRIVPVEKPAKKGAATGAKKPAARKTTTTAKQ